MVRLMSSFPRVGRQEMKRRAASKRRRILIEQLETRRVLAGTVIVLVPGDGTLTLIGDGSNNQVEIRETIAGGFNNTFAISAPDDTDFKLGTTIGNATGQSLPSLTVNFINDDITVNLGDGNDSFRFLGRLGGGKSDIPNDLVIQNFDGSNVNELADLFVHGDLRITKNVASSGYSELMLRNSTIVGDTLVNNVGNGTGDTMTTIDNSVLQGGGAAVIALRLNNSSGKDITSVQGNSQFGTGTFIGGQPVISINNRDGGSRTTFTGASNIAGTGTTTVYGDVLINNGLNTPTKLDIVTFNRANVLGKVDIANADGTTQTMVLGSSIGSHLAAGLGGPLTVTNAAGHDALTVTDSNLPYGLSVNNDAVAAGASRWGSDTAITNSRIGTHPLGPMLPGKIAMVLSGDAGNDVVRIDSTTLGGGLDLRSLFDGSNEVQLINGTILPSVEIVGGAENDRVIINNASILLSVVIRLNAGSDRLEIFNVDPATEWPSPLLGTIVIDGGVGVDFSNLDALTLGALDFELRTV